MNKGSLWSFEHKPWSSLLDLLIYRNEILGDDLNGVLHLPMVYVSQPVVLRNLFIGWSPQFLVPPSSHKSELPWFFTLIGGKHKSITVFSSENECKHVMCYIQVLVMHVKTYRLLTWRSKHIWREFPGTASAHKLRALSIFHTSHYFTSYLFLELWNRRTNRWYIRSTNGDNST